MLPSTLLSQLLSASALAGVRTSWVLLALGLAATTGHLQLPPELALLARPAGLAGLSVLALLEHWTERDEDLQDLLGLLHYGLRGTGALVVAQAFRLSPLAGLHLPPWSLQLLAVGLALLTHHLRRRVYRHLQGWGVGLLSPRNWLLWLESGGMVGVLAALVLAPWLALGLVILGALTALVLAWVETALDRHFNRRPCSCGHPARKEASLCPACRRPLEIQRRLDSPWRPWRRKPRSTAQ